MVWYAALLALGANAGTVVGHPIVSVIGAPTDTTIVTASLPLLELVLDDCEGSIASYEVDDTIDLVSGDIVLPEGRWCGVTLVPGGDLTVTGTGNGGTFSLGLDTGDIELDIEIATPFDVADDSSDASLFEIGAPGWTSATQLGLASGIHVDVDDADTLHDTLVGALLAGAELH